MSRVFQNAKENIFFIEYLLSHDG